MEKSYTVLVVEDEKPLLEVVNKKFQNSGFGVFKARSIEEALGHLEKEAIDVIWLDHYLLGKQNGLDLVSQLKSEDSKWKALPVFVVSNTASPDKVQTYLRLGVNKYYTKSNHKLDDIVNDVKDFLNIKE